VTTKRETAVVICPGRGTYTKTELGYLKQHHRPDCAPFLDALDARLAAIGQPTVSELDGAAQFSPKTHTPGEYASTLIYACSHADYLAIDRERFDIVAVTGNSMGWYTALACAGALGDPVRDAAPFTLVHTMGSMMKDGVIGGQMIYPITGDDWRPDADKAGLVTKAIAEVNLLDGAEVYLSIKFGGYAIIGGNERGLSVLMKSLPPTADGRYPFQLVNHAAFHTPLLRDTSQRAFELLGEDLFQAPTVPMIDGRGVIWQPYSTDVAALRQYTLGHQVTETYDFSAAVSVALKEFAPDRLILVGPGATSGGAIGQILIENAWLGLKDKSGFSQYQEENPYLIAMGRPEQRTRVI
jgi:[acyl-carrier-protein] S-malonyltransferase